MTDRIRGLDALRFLCALCVVQGHLRLGGYLVLDKLDKPRYLVRTVRMLFSQGFPVPTGPNAVIVFFVISGFCIHFPYRAEKKMNFQQFICRRYIRVGLPALVAAFLLYNSGFHSLQDSVLWSIICESIYYSLYPLIIMAKHRVGWRIVIGVAFAVACLVIIWQSGGPYDGNFAAFGAGLTWILGLPCWLLGCLLAETYAGFSTFSRGGQWLLRVGIIVAACVATTLRFYAKIGYYWSEPILAIFVYQWLGTEISYFLARKPWRWLEWCGKWSYSVYLFHAPIAIFVGNQVGHYLDTSPRLLLEVGALLIGSYLLYLVVERPAHLLARRYQAPQRELQLAPGVRRQYEAAG
jgi:peptidoglycan/LPS O-acetylase OafA/YrhL